MGVMLEMLSKFKLGILLLLVFLSVQDETVQDNVSLNQAFNNFYLHSINY